MKLAKMSLAAALLLGANVYAIENIEVKGDAKLYYMSADVGGLFSKDAAAADAALHLGLTADLTENVTAGISATAVSTLGLENNLVSNSWSGAHTLSDNNSANFDPTNSGTGKQVDDAGWIDEAWIAGTAFNTTAKIGRQKLDTPLVFTESWGIDTNTFEALVLINESIPDTTLIGAYIGKSNGVATDPNVSGLGATGYVAAGGKFNSFYSGAYTVGAINNSWKPLSVQAWYYNLTSLASAYWIQADLDMDGILAGAQYTNIDADTADNDAAFAVMLGYAMKDIGTIKAAFSSVDDKGTGGYIGNLATGSGGTNSETKLYTEMWWNFGQVGLTGADSFSIVAETTQFDVDFLLGYYSSVQKTNNASGIDDSSVDEFAVSAAKSFGPLDTALIVASDSYSYELAGDKTVTTIFITLGYNF